MSKQPATLPKKANYHHGDLREALLEAALAMLEAGADPAAFSLREAARRAGVSAMAPYRHFADKDALLAAVATIGFRRLSAALGAADRDPQARVALNAQGVAYVAFAFANPALFRLMFGAKAPEKTRDLAEASQQAFAILVDRLASIGDKAEARDRALAHWALVHGLAMLAVDGQLGQFDATPMALAERITSLPMTPIRGIV